jgi:23S rRNA (cytosine1962-C5)-methyltransferase
VDGDFIRSRVFRAVDYRRLFADLRSCRVVFSESDGLPGLIVDAFGDVLCVQFLCLGIDRFREDVLDALTEALHPAAIYERSDAPVRELEGLNQTAGLLRGRMPERVEILENGVRFLVDVKEGQKTGYFLDQKENRAAIAPFVRDKEVLDCFTHTGAFALHAAHFGAKAVTAVDISEFACECARKNAELNGFTQIEFVTANAFDYLKEKSLSGPAFDVVILDPPAFTKSRATVDAAARGYKEINLRGMKLVRPGGYLVTCSCSQHMSPEAFLNVVKDAAKDARVSLMQVEYRTQGRDHPILPAAPETQYLKCGIFRID